MRRCRLKNHKYFKEEVMKIKKTTNDSGSRTIIYGDHSNNRGKTITNACTKNGTTE
jgi:hypothetical protein